MGKLEDLEKIQELRSKGILTDEEFEIEKKKILNSQNVVMEQKEQVVNKQNLVDSKFCGQCGNKVSQADKFCLKCGNKLSTDTSNNIQNKKPKKIKFNLVVVIIIGILLMMLLSAIVLGILGFSIFKYNKKVDLTNNQSININSSNTSKDNQTANEINIKLYDIYDEKPSIIQLDNTVETGAVYNITKDNLKLAVEKVCKKNNLNYTENSENTENYYGLQIELDKTSSYGISLMLENNKITGIMIDSTKLNKDNTSTLDNKLFNEIITELFETQYANNLITTNNELTNNMYRYTNNTVILKSDLASFLSLTTKTNEDNEYLEQFNNLISCNMVMLIPILEENVEEDIAEINKTFSEYGIYIKEDKMGTKFKGNNSVSYIKFTSDTDFEIVEGDENSEAFIKSGTYIKSGNTITLNVTYDSELEPGDYTGITEPFKPYEMQMNIKDSNTIEYTNNYGYICKFQK